MQSFWRAALAASLLGSALALLPAGVAVAQQDAKPKSVKFKSADGVNLNGNFYPAGGKTNRNAVVMLLHDFDSKNGGSSAQAGWSELATKLQSEGYAVLSFDFRGFGDSKDISKEVFWDDKKFPLNGTKYVSRKAKLPEAIDAKDFRPGYYVALVNDVAAAKAYLDRANDRKEVNSSNVIVIGAGQGAAVGSMWVANECIRRRDKNVKAFGAVNLAEPESQYVAACIWLSISPKIENRLVGGLNGPMNKWLTNAARTHKIPMGFYHGKEDAAGDKLADQLVKTIKNNAKDLEVGSVAVAGTKAAGNKLLDTKTNEQIAKQITQLMTKRGNLEATDKNVVESAYYYVLQNKQPDLRQPSKKAGEEAPLVNLTHLGLQQ